MADVTMPQLGETVAEGTITHWYKQPGDQVDVGDPLFEVSTDKVDSEVPSLLAGVLTDILVREGDTVDVGAVLAHIGDADPISHAHTATETPKPPEPTAVAARPPASSNATGVRGGQRRSPVVRRLIKEHGVDVSTITGTGPRGRITRSDVESAIAARSAPAPSIAVGDTVIPMNRIRKLTGELMSTTKATSPHVFTAVEVDFENVNRIRTQHSARWKTDEGSSLTYLPFVCRAVVDALRSYPHMNASVGDGELIVHESANIAIAVDLDFEGLVAPVVRDAGSMRLRTIARHIVDLANRAKTKKLTADEIRGGTFTITNPGQYGTLMQFPLINQPQVAILSTDGVRRKPVVITDQDGNEAIAIHSVGVLGLAWDHRAFDGAYAAAFLRELRRILETRDWEAEMT